MSVAAGLDFEGAAAYSDRHRPEALFAMHDGAVVFEKFGGDFDARTPHALYSGTKSFWGVAAVAARDDGILTLDETVGATFASWSKGPRSKVTLRHLLSLTAGIAFGGLGNAVPVYEKALDVAPVAPPGTRFTYGGIPLQIFGAVFAAKLRGSGQTPHEYLSERILGPAGVRIARWRSLADDTQPLPTGAFVSAGEWVKYGAFMAAGGNVAGEQIVRAESLAETVAGTTPNPRYGLGWWLSPHPSQPNVFYASGSGGQALYVIPDNRVAVVRYGAGGSFKHDTFLRRLLPAAEEARAKKRSTGG